MEVNKKLLEGKGTFNYNGVLVTRTFFGWEVFGMQCTKPEEVDLVIQNACSSLSESIVVVNNGSISCFNDDSGKI